MFRIDWLSPRPLLWIIFALGVLLPIVPFYRYEDAFSLVWPFTLYDQYGTISKAVLLYTFAVLAFMVGYRFGEVHDTRPVMGKINNEKFVLNSIILIAIGSAAFGIIFYLVGGFQGFAASASDRTRGFAGIQGLFYFINVLSTLTIVWFLRIIRNSTSLSEKIFFVVLSSLILIVVSFQGQKSTLFIMVGSIAVIFNFLVRRVSLAEILIGSAALFVFLMSYHIYKQEYLVLGRVVSLSSGAQFWSSAYEFLIVQFSGNFMQLQTMCVLLEGTPIPLPYQNGYGYLTGLFLLVPRAIWPNKPLPSAGTFTEAFWPAAWRDSGTTLPPGVFGEGYMNFGIFGPIMIGLIGGYVFGILHRRVKANRNDDLALIYYAVAVASMLHFFRGEFASVLYLVLSIALPAKLYMKKVNV